MVWVVYYSHVYCFFSSCSLYHVTLCVDMEYCTHQRLESVNEVQSGGIHVCALITLESHFEVSSCVFGRLAIFWMPTMLLGMVSLDMTMSTVDMIMSRVIASTAMVILEVTHGGFPKLIFRRARARAHYLHTSLIYFLFFRVTLWTL